VRHKAAQEMSEGEAFSQEPFDHFEAFVWSFKFLKKDFYEELEDQLKELKG
jgi:hypothetical protein